MKPNYAIVLNPVYGRAEDRRVVTTGTDRDALVKMLTDDLVDPRWTDDNGYHQSFRKGSVLVGHNPAHGLQEKGGSMINGLGHGVVRVDSAPFWLCDILAHVPKAVGA